jgi:hypothetical protein
MKNIFLALLLAGCNSCTPVPAPVPPEPAPSPDPPPDPAPAPSVADAGNEDAGRDSCARMCGHLRHLGCKAGQPTANGAPCELVCRADKAEPASRLTPTYIACMTKMAKCADEALCAR